MPRKGYGLYHEDGIRKGCRSFRPEEETILQPALIRYGSNPSLSVLFLIQSLKWIHI
jgi:hypothetical protein